jgi:hypothetical protein
MGTTSTHRRTAGRSIACVFVRAAALGVFAAACGGRGTDSSLGTNAAAGPADASPTARPPAGAPVNALVMHPLHTAVLYAALPDGLYWTTGHATSWRLVPVAPPGYYLGLWVDRRPPYTLYAEYFAGTIDPLRLIRSNDGGYTWTDLTDGSAPQPIGDVSGVWLVDRRSGPAAVHVVGDKGGHFGVWQSLDRGDTWVRLRGAESRRAEALGARARPLPAAAQRALDAFMAAFEPNTVYWVLNVTVTDADTGAVLSATTGGPIVDPSDPTHFCLATELGVYRSLDGGRTWHRASAGLPGGETEGEE